MLVTFTVKTVRQGVEEDRKEQEGLEVIIHLEGEQGDKETLARRILMVKQIWRRICPVKH